jgi:cell division protease FtsH
MLQLPDIEGRKAILKIHAKGKPFVKEVDWERVARRTVGYSGADLENMLNEAAILAARLNKKEIDMSDLEEAATKVKMGPEKKRMQSEDDKKITAYHESGHAIVSFASPHADPVHRISIVGRGLSLGHTLIPPAQDRVHETKTRLLETIATMLGGRAAEELIFSEMTTGASDDIQKATELARTMVIEFGMSSLGPVNYDSERERMYGENSQISNEMQAKIDVEIRKIMDKAYADAQKILKENKAKLDKVAGVLLTKETLEGEEFIEMMSGIARISTVKKASPKTKTIKKTTKKSA